MDPDALVFQTNFTNIDWAIVAVYLVASVTIGVLVNRYIHNVGDYMVGGRASGAALNAATYMGTGLGLVTLMYASIEGFNKGFAYMTLGLLGLAISFLLGSTGFVVRRLRALRLTTLPEFFERRFNRRVRIVAGCICALAGILNMGLFPKMGATFITYATGLAGREQDAELLVGIVTTALVVLVLIYTVVGGMVSVIVTDFVQFVVLSIGMGVGLWFCFSRPELGWTNMVDAVATQHGEAGFNPVHPQGYGWMWVIWNAFLAASAYIAWSPEATRALTSKGTTSTAWTYVLASPGQFIRLAIPALWAIAAIALFTSQPETRDYFFPKGIGPDHGTAHAAAAMPLMLGKVVPAGLLGLLVAGLMAAFMSTHDSYFLCWSSVIVRDVIDPIRRRKMSDRQQIRWTRWIIVGIGAFLIAWGIWYELPDSVWGYMAITGTVYLSGAGVAIIGGMYWRGASSAGAMAALLGGLVAVVGLFIKPIHEHVLPELSKEVLAGALGVGNYVFCALLFIVFSLSFPDRNRSDSAGTDALAEQ